MKKNFAVLVTGTLLACYTATAYSQTDLEQYIDADLAADIASAKAGPVPGSAFNITPQSPERAIDKAGSDGIALIEKAVESAKTHAFRADPHLANISKEREQRLKEQGEYTTKAVAAERGRATEWLLQHVRLANNQHQTATNEAEKSANDAANSAAQPHLLNIKQAVSLEEVSAELDKQQAPARTPTSTPAASASATSTRSVTKTSSVSESLAAFKSHFVSSGGL